MDRDHPGWGRLGPGHLLLVTLGSISTAELLLMAVLHRASPSLAPAVAAGTDALLLTLLVFPVLYTCCFRPLTAERQRSEIAEEQLRSVNSALERQVEERTRELREAVASLEEQMAEREVLQRRLEGALRTWTETFQALADGLWVLDVEGRIIQSNGAFERLLGAEAAELLGRHCFEIAHGSNTPVADCPFVRMKESRQRETIEFRDAERGVWLQVTVDPIVDASGELRGAVHLVRDVTDVRRAQEETAEARRDWEDCFSAIPEMITIHDTHFNIRRANRAAQEALKLPGVEASFPKCYAAYHGRQEPPLGCASRQTLQTGVPALFEMFEPHLGKHLEFKTFPRFDAGGQVAGIIHVVRDITTHKQSERALADANQQLRETLTELQQAQEHLVQQERLRALGTMASGIAHDFNNALVPILGYSELLLASPRALDDRTRAIQHLKTMNVAARDAASVVSRLREFYRHRDQSEVLQPTDLVRVAEEVLSLTQPKWRDEAQARGGTIQVHLELEEVPPVAGNPAQLREMLTNLIFNAVDAMPRGGRLTLKTECIEPTVATGQPGPQVALQVSDTGIGMTPEVQQRCLEPFFSTKDDRGTGLGLAVTFGILRRHDGTLRIDSAPGQGTTVTVQLPVLADPPQVQETVTSDEPGRGRSLRVLVIDDEPQVRQLLADYLVEDGHQPELAASGPEGLEQLRTGNFDVVLTDRAMPGMNGEAVAAAVKQAAPEMPVLMITGFGGLMRESGEHPAHVDRLLRKPLTVKELRQALAAVVAE